MGHVDVVDSRHVKDQYFLLIFCLIICIESYSMQTGEVNFCIDCWDVFSRALISAGGAFGCCKSFPDVKAFHLPGFKQ